MRREKDNFYSNLSMFPRKAFNAIDLSFKDMKGFFSQITRKILSRSPKKKDTDIYLIQVDG